MYLTGSYRQEPFHPQEAEKPTFSKVKTPQEEPPIPCTENPKGSAIDHKAKSPGSLVPALVAPEPEVQETLGS